MPFSIFSTKARKWVQCDSETSCKFGGQQNQVCYEEWPDMQSN